MGSILMNGVVTKVMIALVREREDDQQIARISRGKQARQVDVGSLEVPKDGPVCLTKLGIQVSFTKTTVL